MTKVKNKKKLTENVKRKEGKTRKVLNPFEIHVNKEKIKILGRKTKHDRGVPGISRSKALKKRSRTLLQEYKVQNKSNKFIDKRIGERNAKMTEDDKVLARYTALKARTNNKSIFNLADDEILTHRGQTLNEIEKFDDPRSDDDDSIDNSHSGKLDSSFVEDAHFGGGILKKTSSDGAKTHKDLIDQLITESKKRKVEKQKLKEQTLELTEKLDTEWKDLLPLVSNSKKVADETILENKIDEYDKVMRELKFEARGTPSDRLKTEDEIAKEEKENLENLERERLERMRGFIDEKLTNKNYRSADDLDDNFAYDSDPDIVLSYDVEGQSNLKVDAEMNRKRVGKETNCSEDESNGDSANEDDSDKTVTDSEDNLSDLRNEISESESEHETNKKNSKLNSVRSDENQDKELNLGVNKDCGMKTPQKDMQSSRSLPQELTEKNLKEKMFVETVSENINICSQIEEQIKADLLQRKEIMEKARKELPYTFKLPEDYYTLQVILSGKTCEEQSVVLERMIKCNHPSLAEGNKEKLGLLFVYLLQNISDISLELSDKSSIKTCFNIFLEIVPYLFDLAQFSKENSHSSAIEVIKEKQAEFRKLPKLYPDLDVLLFLKLIGCLFPTSDFRHQVVTPSLVFIDQMLNCCKVRTKRDIAYGLYLTMLVLEFTHLSKRYLPSSINFLSGILHMAIPKTGIRLVKIAPPFKSTLSTLVLLRNFSDNNVGLKLEVTDLLESDIDEEFKIRIFYVTLSLLKEFVDNFRELPSNCEIFECTLSYLKMIPINHYPEVIRKQYESLKFNIESLQMNRNLEYVVMEKKRPKALRLYEPTIEKIFDNKRHKVQSKEKAERAKLLHKIRKEHKGALREIRRDNAFLGRVKITQRIQSDLERKEKVKQLLAEASLQQSELKAMDRKRKRK